MRENDSKTIEGRLFFDPDDPIYRNHFPGIPVVPGSMIIHAFFEAVKKAGFEPAFLKAKSFKFRRFLAPGEYRYRLDREREKIVCRLFGQTPKSSLALAEGIFLL